jgi:hypothetical protein
LLSLAIARAVRVNHGLVLGRELVEGSQMSGVRNAWRLRPDPYPAVFGFHEVFHVLVVAAVACQYSAVAFFVLPEH